MVKKNTPYALFLFGADILFLSLALWFTLWLRYLEVPSKDFYLSHLLPFAYIFGIWVVVYFIYDLYRVHISFSRQKLLATLFNVQIINGVIAVLFFYLIPYFNITPKTNMFIFLFVSFIFMSIWRAYLAPRLLAGGSESIVFACRGAEVEQLSNHFTQNTSRRTIVCEPMDDLEIIKERFPDASLIAISTYGSSVVLSGLYQFLFSGLRFVSVENIYEDLFGRVPLSLISERWFLENVSTHPKPFYHFLKRLIDLTVGLGLGLFSLIFYPLVFVLIKFQDGGPMFFKQERVGKRGKVFTIYKFRSMAGESGDQVTGVGRILRSLRIDELPQIWNLIKGDLSLVGPRPERPDYVEKYRDDIPYYDIRHLVSPGLSGWAQLYQENHPHFGPEVEATREKLSYDLYYIKNRSLILDLVIIIKTVRVLLSRSGR